MSDAGALPGFVSPRAVRRELVELPQSLAAACRAIARDSPPRGTVSVETGPDSTFFLSMILLGSPKGSKEMYLAAALRLGQLDLCIEDGELIDEWVMIVCAGAATVTMTQPGIMDSLDRRVVKLLQRHQLVQVLAQFRASGHESPGLEPLLLKLAAGLEQLPSDRPLKVEQPEADELAAGLRVLLLKHGEPLSKARLDRMMRVHTLFDLLTGRDLFAAARIPFSELA